MWGLRQQDCIVGIFSSAAQTPALCQARLPFPLFLLLNFSVKIQDGLKTCG